MNYLEQAEEVFNCMRLLNKAPTFKEMNGISQGEMAMLAYLTFAHDGATAGELTEKFEVGSSRTAAILNTLEKKGFAIRKPDPKDGRRVQVYVTETGKVEAKARHMEAMQHMAEFLKLLGPEDAKTLLRIIKNAAHNVAQNRNV